MATITSLSFRMNSFYNGEGMRQARADIARLDSSMNALSKSSKALKPGMMDLVSTILMLGPAIVPIAGGLMAIGVAAGSAFVAAGAAVGLFAMAMKGAISQTVGAGSAFGQTNAALDSARAALAKTVVGTKEYDKALVKVTTAEKAHAAAIAAMPPVQQKFAKSIDNISAVWQKMIKDTASFTLKPATTAVEAASAAIPQFTSVIKAISPEIQRVADATKAWVTDGGLDRFLTFVKSYGVPALNGFVTAMRSLFGALGQGMRDTAPLGTAFVAWLVKTMAAFNAWATGGGFERFLVWLQANKGGLIQTAKDLGTFLANIGTAVNSMSGAAFTVLGTFFKVLASFPPGLLAAIMYAFIGITLALKLYAVIAFIAAAATTAMTLAATPFGILLLGMALTIGAVIAAIIALAVGIYFLVKHWDTVWGALKTAALAVWNALKVAWEYVWNAIKTVAMAVWNFLTTGWGQAALLLLGPIGIIALIAMHWDTIWNGIKSVASAVWNWIKSAWAATVGWISEKFFALIEPIRVMWNTVWPEMQLAATNVWNALKTAWNAVWNFFKGIWDWFWSIFGGEFKAGWAGITAVATAAWEGMKTAWSVLWELIKGVASTAWAILQGIFNVAVSVVTGIWNVFTSALSGAWNILWSVITSIFNVFVSVFGAIFSGAWEIIKTVATGVWNIIKAAWDVLWKAVTAIFLVFTAIFTGNWSKAWNAIKDVGQAIWNLIRTIFQTVLNAITAAFNFFVGIFRAAWNAFLTGVQTVWNAIWNAIKNFISTLWNSITALATTFWNAIKSVFNAGINAVKTAWDTVWNAIKNFVLNAFNSVVQFADNFWTGLKRIFSVGSTWIRETFWNPVANFFTKTIPSAFEAAVSAIGKGWDKLKQIVRAPIQAVVDVVYNNGIVKMWNLVAGVFGAGKLDAFTLPKFKDGGPTGSGSAQGFPAILHPDEHVWTAREVQAAGGHEAVANLRRQAMGGSKVRLYGDHQFEDGGGFLGTGWGWNFGPDLVPDGIIKNVWNGFKDLALGAIAGPFNKAVDVVANLGKKTVRAMIPGSDTAMEQLSVGMIDKIADTIKSWVTTNDVAPTLPTGGGNGFVPWKAWASGDGTKQNYGGHTVNRRTAAMLNNATRLAKSALSITQGSYSNSVGASAGTHSGGGAVDLGPAKDTIVGAMRASGFAAWRRTPAEGFSPHVHGIAVGDPTVSAGAAQQVRDFAKGLNGLAGGGKDTYSAPGGGTATGAPQTIAKAMLAQFGFGQDQWSGLQALWQRESGWNPRAKNPSSGAYGIPQSLPASKMSSAGPDYLTNAATQIKWGLGYIKGRYGTPNKADAFQRANNWYGRGTRSAAPGWGVVGDRGLELMRMRGGEQIRPMNDLSVNGGNGEVHLTVNVDARGATVAAVQRLETVLPDKLRMALEQGTGRRS